MKNEDQKERDILGFIATLDAQMRVPAGDLLDHMSGSPRDRDRCMAVEYAEKHGLCEKTPEPEADGWLMDERGNKYKPMPKETEAAFDKTIGDIKWDEPAEKDRSGEAGMEHKEDAPANHRMRAALLSIIRASCEVDTVRKAALALLEKSGK